MNRRTKIIALICSICLMMTTFFTSAEAADVSNQNKAGGSIRFGYVESEEYGSFTQLLLDMALELVEEGSIAPEFRSKYENINFENTLETGDTRKLWNDICDANVKGARYQFVKEAFFDLDEMDESEYEKVANRDDVDITLSMGTASGVYLAEHEKKNKFMNMFSGDPIASQIVKSETERFDDRSFALVDQTSYVRQLDAGYKFLGFKKLGVVYEDSEDAYIYSAIDVVEKKASEYGFEVLYEHVDEPVSDDDYDRYYSELKQAYRRLVNNGVDCLLITVASIDYEEKMQELLDDYVIPSGIKTIAQDELLPVQCGALFGITLTDCEESANHMIKQIRRYNEEGVPFDELDMVCEATPQIGVNFTTAQRIGFDISFENLQMVDYIYRNDD